MTLVNHIAVDTRWGLRHFELHLGDITLAAPVDLLTLSVLGGSYEAGPGSTLSALQGAFGFNLGDCARDPEFDLRLAFGCWVSRPLSGTNFRRVLCDEHLGPQRTFPDVIQNVFAVMSALESKGIELKTMAMPLVGTGVQRIDPRNVARPLIEHALAHLERSRSLTHIRFVEIRPDRVQRLSEAMDEVLGRRACGLPETVFAATVARELVSLIASARTAKPDFADRLREIEALLGRESASAPHLFLAARTLTECVVQDLGGSSRLTLFQRIDALRPAGVSPWVVSYLHVLRVFGNEGAHVIDHAQRSPAHPHGHDLQVLLVCMHRVLECWAGEHERISLATG